MASRTLRCAIYTRKSSEEGLSQDFNSLDAQREACEAYIASQKHEGWKVLADRYDDGGYSGGSMERPALRSLLTAIHDRKVDVVVVYKVDRLTRSLADFAKIVEILDAHGTTFVSVTQAFNTTSSMGRLTLNVLLSFAQFEREVTGERIRDKIAASKAKGMWMGGHVPMGYRRKDRSLVIDETEAELVRSIFRRYLELGTVEALQKALSASGIVTPIYESLGGRRTGGRPFGRGHLYQMLSNVLYTGKIAHRDQVHDGLHEAIIDQTTWDLVQSQLNRFGHRERAWTRAKDPSLLAGLVRDDRGRRMGVTHSQKNGVRHRYYRSTLREEDTKQSTLSIPASVLEPAIVGLLVRRLRDQDFVATKLAGDPENLSDWIARAAFLATELEQGDAVAKAGVLATLVREIRIETDRIEIDLLRSAIGAHAPEDDAPMTISEPLRFSRRGHELKLAFPAKDEAATPDAALIKGLAQAHRWWRDLQAGRYATFREIAEAYGNDERYVAFVLRLAFLSPELTRQILEGRQPRSLTLHKLLWDVDIPLCWNEQRRILGTDAYDVH